MNIVLLVILIVVLLGVLPTWPYSSGWGYYPSGIIGLIIVVLLDHGADRPALVHPCFQGSFARPGIHARPRSARAASSRVSLASRSAASSAIGRPPVASATPAMSACCKAGVIAGLPRLSHQLVTAGIR